MKAKKEENLPIHSGVFMLPIKNSLIVLFEANTSFTDQVFDESVERVGEKAQLKEMDE